MEILYEADAWAEMEGARYVSKSHVEKAVKEKIFRSDKYEKKLLELVEEGQILLDLSGEKVGQINGLAVLNLGTIFLADLPVLLLLPSWDAEGLSTLKGKAR